MFYGYVLVVHYLLVTVPQQLKSNLLWTFPVGIMLLLKMVSVQATSMSYAIGSYHGITALLNRIDHHNYQV